MYDSFYRPNPDVEMGRPVIFPDPDSARPTFGIFAKDRFPVQVVAGDIETMPGVGIYVPEPNREGPERVVFGFKSGVQGAVLTPDGVGSEGEWGIRFISRHEAKVSVRNHRRIERSTIGNGKLLLVMNEIEVPTVEELEEMVARDRARSVANPTVRRPRRGIIRKLWS